jgi:hypothetical protein
MSIEHKLEQAIAVIEGEANDLDQWVRETRAGGWSTQHVDQMTNKADRLRRVAAELRR